MPLFMDVHEKVEGLTAEAVANAHAADLQVQGGYGVDYQKYWFDEDTGKVFCLVDAPDAEAAHTVHRERHTAAMRSVAGRSARRRRVGRDDALAHLGALVDEAVAGDRLTTALLEGPAGIGKTRVVSTLAEHLAGREVDVLVGHCVASGGQTLPYAPLVEVLAELVRREGASAVRRFGAWLPVKAAPRRRKRAA